MLSLAFIVGISSEVRITAITSGFIIAMSVLMMSLFSTVLRNVPSTLYSLLRGDFTAGSSDQRILYVA